MKTGPKPKTLLEHFEDHTFRWDRHRSLLRDDLELRPEEIPLVVELAEQLSDEQIAARFRLPVHTITNVITLYRRTRIVNRKTVIFVLREVDPGVQTHSISPDFAAKEDRQQFLLQLSDVEFIEEVTQDEIREIMRDPDAHMLKIKLRRAQGLRRRRYASQDRERPEVPA